ncbi:uncharacterized protein LOC126821016 isoform X2 [Patella vulgata]|uniref:uncharacterized protein LOC126821016 isoform X2 n=1 Tax=Patella vulgata TaxID=6465 RepID=UPI0024A9CB02|nr:uncharacterized protein LOC126821016 isoform X2 [Patella vulgata]
MCFLTDSTMKNKRKRSRIPVLIGRQDIFKAKRRKLDMMRLNGRSDEVLYSSENEYDEGKTSSCVLPPGLFEGNLMLDALGGFLIFVSKSGNILFVSEQVEEYLGYSQVEMIGRPIETFIHQNDLHEIKINMKIKKGGNLHTLEGGHINKDEILNSSHCRSLYIRMKTHLNVARSPVKKSGTMLTQWIGQIKVRPSKKPKGYSVDGIVCICHPVQSDAILEIRLEGNMFMSRHDLGMKFLFCEQRIIRLIGYRPDDLIGRTAYQFHNPLDTPNISNCHSNLIVKGASTSKFYRFMGKNGDWIWLQTRATIIKSTTNEAQYIVCMNYVISQEEGEKWLKMEQEQFGFTDPNVRGCLIFDSNDQVQGSCSETIELSDPVVMDTDVEKDEINMEPDTNFLNINFDINSTEELLLDNAGIATSPVTMSQSADPFLCSTSTSSNNPVPIQSPLHVGAADNVVHFNQPPDEMDILDDILENIQHFPSETQSKTISTSLQTLQNLPLPCQLGFEDHEEAEVSVPQCDSQNNTNSCSLLSLNASQERLSSQMDDKAKDLGSTDNSYVPSLCPGNNNNNNANPLIRHSCQLDLTSPYSCLSSSSGSLLRSLLYRDRSPPRIPKQPVSSRSPESIPKSPSAQNLSSSFYTTSSSSDKSPSSCKSLLSAVLSGNATLNIPTCQKNLPQNNSSHVQKIAPTNVENRTFIRKYSSLTNVPQSTNEMIMNSSCIRGHTCHSGNSHKTGVSHSTGVNFNSAVKNPPNISWQGLKSSHLNAKPLESSNYVGERYDIPTCSGKRRRCSQDSVAASDLFGALSDLPDDLLDVAMQYYDNLGDDQTQALLEEFGQDIWANTDDLCTVTTETQVSPTSTNKKQTNFGSSNTRQILSQSANQPSSIKVLNDLNSSDSTTLRQENGFNFFSPNRDLSVSRKCLKPGCDKTVDNSNNNNTNYQRFGGCCNRDAYRNKIVQDGLQSPTVSSTQANKNISNDLETLSGSSSSECNTVVNDGTEDSVYSQSSSSPKSCQSIGVQTAYTNTDTVDNKLRPKNASDTANKSKTTSKMSELEKHLRGYKSFSMSNIINTNQSTTSCSECENIARYSKITPFLHKLLTGEITQDIYYQVDKYILESEKQPKL